MKPLEVTSPGEGEMECELHSKEFFVQVGMLVIEGRTPQQSERGRIEGKHALQGHAKHVCQDRDKECQEAKSYVQQIEHHWQNNHPITIDVVVQLTEQTDTIILLEQWTVSIVSHSNSPSTSGSQLQQAVRSHIHFSQLSAWLSLSRGVLPYSINYSLNHEQDSFIQEPTLHVFPLASLPGQRSLQVTVKSLPRCSLKDLIDTLESSRNTMGNNQPCSYEKTMDNNQQHSQPSGETFYNAKPCRVSDGSPCSNSRSPLRKRTCLKEVTSVRTRSNKPKDLSTSSSSQCNKQSGNLENDFSPLENDDKPSLDSNVLGACCSNWESNGIGNLNARIERLGTDIDKIERAVNQADRKFSGLGNLLQESRNSYTQHDSDSKESVKDRQDKTVHGKESKQWDTKDMTKMLLRQKYRGEQDTSSSNGASCQQAKPLDSHLPKQSPSRLGTASNSRDVDIHAIKQPVDRACFRRSVQLPIGACTEPVFNPKTGLPVSSSPAPLRRSTNELYEDTTDFSDGLSSKVNYRELSKLLSRSAPASTTQSLLVNFEESVLNGRMEPVGTVEGFTAELSASGSFCPRHVKLPIISCFYRLSDDDAPSPYMGYISLKDEPLGRRGYHVPVKGTIQLIVFNPNKTVVKMFVVLYDCSDMPPKSQTFLRQKTYSALKGNVVKNEAHQTLHYLLHLRFATSKSGKIYLHTDIRVIFARQPPDLGYVYQLFTVTDGPTDPKYTRRHHISLDPEC